MPDHCKTLLFCVFVFFSVQVYGHEVNLTILERAVSKGAVCLDGTPPGYYHDPGSGDGISNWMLFLEGGSWCEDRASCVARFDISWGSSKHMAKSVKYVGIMSPSPYINPYFYNWNRVFIRYCDGSSFSSDYEEVDPADNIHRRGARIFKYVVQHLMKKGMKHAKNAILAGGSSGGMSSMLRCDNFKKLAPHIPRLKCIADCGFFVQGKNLPAPNMREGFFREVVEFHRLNKTLPRSCTSRMDHGLCMFPTNFVGDIKTPIFIVNSAFDGSQMYQSVKHPEHNWQNCLEYGQNCTNAEIDTIKGFGKTMVEELPRVDYNSSRGMFIDSCYFHDHITMDDRWNGKPRLKNKTISEAFNDWYFDRSPFQEIELEHVTFPYNCSV